MQPVLQCPKYHIKPGIPKYTLLLHCCYYICSSNSLTRALDDKALGIFTKILPRFDGAHVSLPTETALV